MAMRAQVPVSSAASDDELGFIREMGISDVSLALAPDELTLDVLRSVKERFGRFNLNVSDAYCMQLQKNKSIHLALPDRDEQIGRFVHMLELFGQAEIPFTSIAWQPNGILRTGFGVGEHTRGGISMLADIDEIKARPIANGREYGEEEIWGSFRYFLARVTPVCEKTGVKMALHPSDPPISKLVGVHSLIYNSQTYRKAFAMAKESPILGMKLCVGCWLEGGEAFGNLLDDIKEFCGKDKILSVHFRNVSSPMPRFEETLAEDGYANMYTIMKQLVACGCDAVISIDHAFKGRERMGGTLGAFAYPTGYMKGLMHSAEIALGLRTYQKYTQVVRV